MIRKYVDLKIDAIDHFSFINIYRYIYIYKYDFLDVINISFDENIKHIISMIEIVKFCL